MGNKQGHICIVLFFFLDQGFHFLLASSREMEIMDLFFRGGGVGGDGGEILV